MGNSTSKVREKVERMKEYECQCDFPEIIEPSIRKIIFSAAEQGIQSCVVPHSTDFSTNYIKKLVKSLEGMDFVIINTPVHLSIYWKQEKSTTNQTYKFIYDLTIDKMELLKKQKEKYHEDKQICFANSFIKKCEKSINEIKKEKSIYWKNYRIYVRCTPTERDKWYDESLFQRKVKSFLFENGLKCQDLKKRTTYSAKTCADYIHYDMILEALTEDNNI